MSLIDEARIEIRRYLENGNRRSISDLARRSHTPYSTVRRIAQGESQEVQFETLLSILSVFMDQKDLSALIAKHSPRWEKLFAYMNEHNYELLNKQETPVWQDVDIYILALAGTPDGVSRERIERDYGREIGGKRLEALCELEILREERGCFKTRAENFSDPSYDSVLRRIELHAKTFNKNHIGCGAFFRYYVQPVTDEELEQVREATRDYLDRVFTICEKSASGLKAKSKVLMLNMLGNFLSLDKEGERK